MSSTSISPSNGGAVAATRRPPRTRPRRYDRSAIGFVLPVLILLTLMVAVPLGKTVYYSLTHYSGLDSPHYIGLENFKQLVSTQSFRRVVRNNVVLLLGLFIWVGLPFYLAVILHGRRRAHLVRTVLFVPVLLPPVVIGNAFRIVLADDGPVNGLLGGLGLGSLGWLTDDRIVLLSVALVIAWALMGIGVLFYSAGLASIPNARIEAARIDGAAWRHLVRHVYRPALKPVTRFFILLLIISTVTAFFPWIYSLTHGGPGVASYTLDFDIYQSGILAGDYGTASAIAVCSLLFLVIVLGAMMAASALSRRLWRSPRLDRVRRVHPPPLRLTAIPLGTRTRAAHRLRGLIVLASVAAVVLPLAWVLRLAFKPQSQWIASPASLAGGWTLDNFTKAWTQGSLGDGLLNSALIVPLGAVIASAAATLAGFALAKLRLPGRRRLLTAIALCIFVPLPAIAIPLFNQALSFGYADSRIGLSVVYGALFSAWATLFMYSYFQDLPDELLDSARVDGASPLRTFLRVVLPLATPALAAVLLMNLLIQWNELIVALVMLPDEAKQTVTVAIASFATLQTSGGPLTAAGALIAAAPIVITYGIGQRFIKADVLAGALKG